MMRLTARNVRIFDAGLLGGFALALLALTGCDNGSKGGDIVWKLRNADTRTYMIQMNGTARMEPDLFNFERERLLVNGAPVTVGLKDETFLVVRNTGGSALEGEYVTGPSSYVAHPDTTGNILAQQTLAELFGKKAGLSLGKFEIEELGAYKMPTVNPFLAMKILLRTPEGGILESKQANLPRMGYTQEQICLNLYNRRIKSHEQNTNITLDRVFANERGETIAEMRYIVTEKVETEYQQGDLARRQFIKRFNDWNLLGLRPLSENEDDVQKVYTCKYKGRHNYNVTRGWLESVQAEQSIEVIKYLDEGTKVIEILRARIRVTPTNQKIVPSKAFDDLDLMTEAEQKESPPVAPAAMQKLDTRSVAQFPEAKGAPKKKTPSQDLPDALPLPDIMPAGDSLPDPDIDSREFAP